MPSFTRDDPESSFWARVRAQAAAEHRSIKVLILRLLREGMTFSAADRGGTTVPYMRIEAGGLYVRDSLIGDLSAVVVCRRRDDYPEGDTPPGELTMCSSCRALIVTDWSRFPDRDRRCMQCCGVIPMPLEP
jgi:hypothetical protein